MEIRILAIQGSSSYPQINADSTVKTFYSSFTADDAHQLPSAGKISRLYVLRFVLNGPVGVYFDAPETIEVRDAPSVDR